MRATTERTEKAEPSLKLWALRARDVNEPPFFHSGVPSLVLVAATDAASARRQARGALPGSLLPNSQDNAWEDERLVTCEEFSAKEPGFVASA